MLLDQTIEVRGQVSQLVAGRRHLGNHQSAPGDRKRPASARAAAARSTPPDDGRPPDGGQTARGIAASSCPPCRSPSRSSFNDRSCSTSDLQRFAGLAADIAEVLGQLVGHLLRPPGGVRGELTSPSSHSRSLSAGRPAESPGRARPAPIPGKAAANPRPLVADHSVQGFDDDFARRNPARKPRRERSCSAVLPAP